MAEGLRERFDSKWMPVPFSGCWIWLAAVLKCRNLEYGVIGINAKTTGLAHRVSWMLFRGSIPVRSSVLHQCDVPLCVNPNHLFLGTQQDNVTDMIQKGRGRNDTTQARLVVAAKQLAKTHCKHGHAFEGENLFIQNNGARGCRECCRKHLRESRARNKERGLSNG